MTHDQQTVLSAYDDIVKKLFCTLFDAYAQDEGDANQEKLADQRFAVGVAAARRARDRAVGLSA
jgi:hypothetical protein